VTETPGQGELRIVVRACGLCHSDLHLMHNSWGTSQFPMIPGHEVVGVVDAIGEGVPPARLDQRVGVGWQCGACGQCRQCRDGHDNLCPDARHTCVGRPGEMQAYGHHEHHTQPVTYSGATMSSYENYDEVSRVYDRMRRPVGVQQTLAWLSRIGPAETLEILDAGCGTGQFSEALLPHVRALQCVELNPGMLDVARRKLATAGPDVTLQQGDLLDLPLADSSVDGLCINQVVHHLPDDDTWSLHRRAFAEVRRVLRPGGSFILNTATAEQIAHGYWYFGLLPDRALHAMADRYAPLDRVHELLRAVGFDEVERHVPDEVIFGENYLRSDGPLDPDWRRADSTWTHATPTELDAILDRVRAMQAAGTLDAWMHAADAKRGGVGQVTLVAAR